MESIYAAFAVSILRSLFLVAGGWLVSRGLVDDGLAREVAAGLALIVVTQVWGFMRIHRRRLVERWLVAIGLDCPPDTDPAVVVASANDAAKRGLLP
jgi:hypothetical protein